MLDVRQKNVGEEATAREEAAALGGRSRSAGGPLEEEKTGVCPPSAFL